ncbi:hypothetical protein BDV24DRAFT_151554 [Aspergillus arachidicola]|uniref:Uncharacterized protein n=1 Tax=Aspergillus arachidicola TaxID=656916 RepID=A0A5N6Y7R4_9EURO|nr:hypothetical protein BDV24DRAFT_151554 [Aspergillus arachidicola]
MTFFTFGSPVKGKKPLLELGWDWVDGTRPVLVRNTFLWLSGLGPIGGWEKCTDHRLCGGEVRTVPWMCLRLEWSLGYGKGGLVVIDGIPCICVMCMYPKVVTLADMRWLGLVLLAASSQVHDHPISRR